jgi:hypothetical protein
LPALDLVLAQQASNTTASAARTHASLMERVSRFRPHGAAEAKLHWRSQWHTTRLFNLGKL